MAGSVETVNWQRHDLPGYETCHLFQHDNGWQLCGSTALTYAAKPCRLEYRIDCDRHWVTQLAVVTGWVGSRLIEIEVTRSMHGQWSLNGTAAGAVDGCIDIDLNFSPSTNLLPIRRNHLAVGEHATVQAAWLRFPGFELEPLE